MQLKRWWATANELRWFDPGIFMGRQILEGIFSQAGITLFGERPWDIQIKNEKFFERVVAEGSMGMGESYMDGWWECVQLDEMICRIFRVLKEIQSSSWREWLYVAKSKWFNQQSRSKAFEIAHRHYDLGNDLYENMLDRRMVYSCGYWEKAKNLDEAQEHKLDLVCRKLGLKPGMTLLDAGCGWGSLAQFAAEKYQVQVTGITVSQEQRLLAQERCRGLPVEIRLQDYRDLNGTFDRIASVGMFEHVGYKNYRSFMKVVHRCLAADGLFLLHTIGSNTSETSTDPWIEKYIFPNSLLPSIKQIGEAIEGLFMMEDWHNFGPDYDKTLMAWYQNFERNWDKLKNRYDERFFRMWRFYLLSCAGSFRSRKEQVWQVLLSKTGLPIIHFR